MTRLLIPPLVATLQIVFSLAYTTQARERVGEPPCPATIHIAAERLQFKKLEPIAIEYVIKNSSNDCVFTFFDSNSDLGAFVLSVRLRGDHVSKTNYLAGLLPGGQGKVRFLAPGGYLKGKIIPNLFYDMTADGEYSVKIGILLSCRKKHLHGMDHASTSSDALKITVVGGPG